MRRLDNVWEKFLEYDNFEIAAKKACSSRHDKFEVGAFLSNKEALLKELIHTTRNHYFRSSKYRMFEVHEKGKVRLVADLPLYPDRILHWAIALVIEEPLNRKLIEQTHASRPGHGCHSAITAIKGYLANDSRIKYALQVDVKKCFPSMNKSMVKERMREVLKDEDMLMLLDTIIDDYPYDGIAIGGRLSPLMANLVLSPIDHLLKEKHKVHYLVRYMDDMVILGYSKPWLHSIKNKLELYLNTIGLEMKGNWQIYPIDARGIQFVGYRIWTDHIWVRKNIKKNIKSRSSAMESRLLSGKMLDKHDLGALASYEGILKWCDGENLSKKTLGRVKELNQKNIEQFLIAKKSYQLEEVKEEVCS